jgi:hypothetical protein
MVALDSIECLFAVSLSYERDFQESSPEFRDEEEDHQRLSRGRCLFSGMPLFFVCARDSFSERTSGGWQCCE